MEANWDQIGDDLWLRFDSEKKNTNDQVFPALYWVGYFNNYHISDYSDTNSDLFFVDVPASADIPSGVGFTLGQCSTSLTNRRNHIRMVCSMDNSVSCVAEYSAADSFNPVEPLEPVIERSARKRGDW
mmetsp:Transcript_39905/g.63069  ORF Transcript_39905/g.63069 Transcript_39905/m.63069 type:complete len:128 (+) Transcript_39905:532-915(+)|eukprot:CAMPEP_0201536986 /NCGR_PEP_ID=MMETSP0161_2-20130828/63429_1 /ASSEMBLY_ACC=CAM_ASM_000251 /TAXON_ID=180227 /ORGANISM="Neoparamoeba aestuarina, Strain SoJaBio B1-5/56/2" /LENGTH=127 /DNA_ID=CAMNT_0047943013 /DNA_START=505 /DNA_END=888 /DNA_ORIENTATION=-